MPFTTLHGIEIHLQETGDGEPVLYLHSGPGHGGDWRGVVEALGPFRRHLTPDLHDRGRSGFWPDPASYSLDREAEMALEIIEARGGRAHLVGHSYGGAVAARMAALAPERLASLTLIEPQLIDLLRDAGETDLHAEVIAHYHTVLEDLGEGESDRAWTRFIDEYNGPGAYAALPERMKTRLHAMNPRMGMYFAALRDNPVGTADLAAITAPTLVILGERTTEAERRMAEIAAARVPGARRVAIRGAGHMAPLTHPGRVAEVLETHLAAHPLVRA